MKSSVVPACVKSAFIGSILAFALFGQTACSQLTGSNPISEDKMVDILMRIHLVEAKVNNSYLRSDTALMYYRTLEDSLFKQYEITKDEFHASFRAYCRDPRAIDRIYARVLDSLSLREGINKLN